MLVKMRSNRNSHSFLVRTQNGTLWKTVWQFLTKLRILLPYDPAIMLIDIYPNKLKYNVHTKIRHTNIYSSLIHNCQKLEATKMSFNRWMDKQMPKSTASLYISAESTLWDRVLGEAPQALVCLRTFAFTVPFPSIFVFHWTLWNDYFCRLKKG